MPCWRAGTGRSAAGSSLLPGWWALALAPGGPDAAWVALFAIGALAMRGAGCIVNDLIDRKFDPRVEHPPPPARRRPGRRRRGAGSSSARNASSACSSFSASTVRDPGGAGLGAADRDLSLHEADHLVAAGVPRHHLQLGRAGRASAARRPARSLARPAALCRGLLLDARLRHDLRPSGQGRRRADRGQVERALARRRDPARLRGFYGIALALLAAAGWSTGLEPASTSC